MDKMFMTVNIRMDKMSIIFIDTTKSVGYKGRGVISLAHGP